MSFNILNIQLRHWYSDYVFIAAWKSNLVEPEGMPLKFNRTWIKY